MAERDAALEAARRRRLLARLDKALAARGVRPPPKRAATPAESTQRARFQARVEYETARTSYDRLREAIQAEGGIRPNRDYPAREIPRDFRASSRPLSGRAAQVHALHTRAVREGRTLTRAEVARELGVTEEQARGLLRRRHRGGGLAPDEMADVLMGHGFGFDGDSELVEAIHARRERLERTHEEVRRVAARHGPSVVCSDNCRNPHGMFARCENAARRAVRTCATRWRDAIGRFREDPQPRRRVA